MENVSVTFSRFIDANTGIVKGENVQNLEIGSVLYTHETDNAAVEHNNKNPLVSTWLPRLLNDYEKQARINGFTPDISAHMLRGCTLLKPRRITEQDAREILESAIKPLRDVELFQFSDWWHYAGRTLLAKLNENRETDYKAMADELLASGIEVIEYLDFLYSKGLIEKPCQYKKLKAAIAKHESINNAPEI